MGSVLMKSIRGRRPIQMTMSVGLGNTKLYKLKMLVIGLVIRAVSSTWASLTLGKTDRSIMDDCGSCQKRDLHFRRSFGKLKYLLCCNEYIFCLEAQ